MKEKTIKKIIQGKLQKWADSVNDPSIKKIIEENVIVTGGSIASMLLNEPVNDFDVYLNNKEAVKAVANYYSKGIANLEILDGKDFSGYDYSDLEKRHVDGMSHQKGRCVHKIESDRVKIFIPDFGIKKIEVDEENKQSNKFLPLFFSSNAITLTDDLQIVIRFHGPAEEIHKNYDFVHATNYYTSKDKKLTLRPEAVTALLVKDLRYIGSKYPLTSVIRSKKFILRGYTCGASTYLKMLYQVSQLDLDDLTVLEDQLAGVDVAYFEILLNALQKMQENGKELNYGYLCTILDKIFNDEEL